MSPSDALTSSRCPRCRPPQILVSNTLRGASVRVCNTCKGLLVRRTDLETLVAAVARAAHGERKETRAGGDYFDRLRSAAQFAGNPHHLSCPECRYDMHEVTCHDLMVDFCLNCQSIWFDEGELHQAFALARDRGDFDLIPPDLNGNDTASLICYMLDSLA